MKVNWRRGFEYWFVHFSVEVMCFFVLFRVFGMKPAWWGIAVLYDTLAFAPQAVIGELCNRFPKLRPGIIGAILLFVGGVAGLAAQNSLTVRIIGIAILAIGNAFVHINGAFVTLSVSEGRLSESALFVGGGSFGLITGRLLSGLSNVTFVPFVIMAAALVVICTVDREMRREDGDCFDFTKHPCSQDIASDKAPLLIILILGLVVMVRAYIGYGLPTAWNRTAMQTFFLYIFMGLGKMSGGILADRFGARRIGVISCLLAVPLLLISNNIMWLSLIGVALFSMTMAITLGGLVSVLKSNPGVAFGITTIGLLLGTLPALFYPMPERMVCDILITVMSVLAAFGLGISLKKA